MLGCQRFGNNIIRLVNHMSRRQQEPPSLESVAGLLERDTLIKTPELAVYLRTSENQLDIWASRGGGPVFIKTGNARLYDPSDVKKWLKSRRFSAAGGPLTVAEESAA